MEDIEEMGIEEITDFSSYYANYCKNHVACHNYEFKESCKLIKNQKNPGWC